MRIREKWFVFRRRIDQKVTLTKKYSIIPIALHSFGRLHIVQPQREGDGRQALVVPPLYPAPATSLNLDPSLPEQSTERAPPTLPVNFSCHAAYGCESL